MSGTQPQPPTRHGLLPEARHLVLPAGIATTGWPAVEAVCNAVGIGFDPWQADLNTAILAKRSNGLYAADVVGISICRQAGKTYDVGGLLFADCIINPGTLAVWTAHHFTVTRESFMALKVMAEMPQMRAHIDPDAITTGAGNECIPFRNGSRILFKARESGAVRGVAKVRRLILDEGQILSERAMADLAPTMNQATNPQIIVMGTPPKPTDDSEFFKTLRSSALAGESEDAMWIEFGADPGAKWDDEVQRRKANPSYPLRTNSKAIARLKKLLTGPGDFEREAFGIWDVALTARAVFPWSRWSKLTTVAPPTAGNRVLAVKFSIDGARVSASAAIRPDLTSDLVHVECIGVAPMSDGTAWLVDKIAASWRSYACIVVDGKSGAGDFVNALRAKKVPAHRIISPTTDQVITAHSGFLRAILDAKLTHLGQPGLDVQVKSAARRRIGMAGGWGIEPASEGGDVVAAESAIFAHWAAMTSKRRTSGEGRTSNGRRGAVVM